METDLVVLEEAEGLELKLVNARHVKQVPGRKTDVKDAEWLAQLLEHGLLASSFVPPPVIRQLRDLTRYRKRLIQDRTRETQRVDKVLEDAAIKLGSVAPQMNLSAQFWQLARRIGKKKAAVAVAQSILVIVYHLLDRDVDYTDLGGDYFVRRVDPERRTRRLVEQLEALGHTVTLTQAA